jgi:regulatory protein YycH of two-component signal transduction system YycFG
MKKRPAGNLVGETAGDALSPYPSIPFILVSDADSCDNQGFFFSFSKNTGGHRYHRLPKIPVQIPAEIFQTKFKVCPKFIKIRRINKIASIYTNEPATIK